MAGAGHWRVAEAGIEVVVGIGAEEARRAHAGHIRRITDGRPHVTLELAVSADDKGGLSGRRPVQITGSAVRNRVHVMRAMSDAVLTGIGTVLSDDPLLTSRLPGMADRSPVRVVLDSGLRMPAGARLVATARETPLWVVTGEAAPREREHALLAGGAEVLRVRSPKPLDLQLVLKALAARGITRLMVETGPILSAAFLAADLVDEAVLFRSPNAIGPDGLDALEGMPLEALTRSPRLHLIDSETAGEDTVEHYLRRGD